MNGTMVSESFKGRELAIYLPPSYDGSRSSFPVAYVQDGCTLFDPQHNDVLIRLERMFADGVLGELMLVGVEPGNRLDEYTPWPAKALSEQFADFGGKGFGYAAFLTAELKPYIDRAYRTDSRPQSTGMIGASLGGLISLYTAYLYPNVIGRIGSISGSLWYEDFIDFMQTEKIDYSDLKVYMDVGSEEGSGKQSIQKDMVPNTRRAHAILAGIGLTGDRLRFVEEEGMPHGPAFFVKRFPEAVKWLFAGE